MGGHKSAVKVVSGCVDGCLQLDHVWRHVKNELGNFLSRTHAATVFLVQSSFNKEIGLHPPTRPPPSLHLFLLKNNRHKYRLVDMAHYSLKK